MDYKNLTGRGNRTGFAATQADVCGAGPARQRPRGLKDATVQEREGRWFL